ncbi:hypothetical protein N657DRAFT_706541, partial [Parathielavia appendiculata]
FLPRPPPPVSVPAPASSTGRAATPEPTFCTVDVSRVPEEHAGEATPVALRKLVEKEMQAPGDQSSWRCAAVTRDGGTANRLRVVGKNKEELKKTRISSKPRRRQGQESFGTSCTQSKLATSAVRLSSTTEARSSLGPQKSLVRRTTCKLPS